MNRFNLVVVFDKDNSKVLMCLRKKIPYKGKLNFVGGKVEKNEDSLKAGYRELFEETNISEKDIKLKHLIDIKAYADNYILEIFYGKLKEDIEVFGEENELFWISLNENFNDLNKFAGFGNIFYILEYIKELENEGRYE